MTKQYKFGEACIAWVWNVLIWIDQGFNTVFGPLLNILFKPARFGNPDETLSSVFGKYSDQCVWCNRICRVLHWIDKDHCKKSIEEDENVTNNRWE